VADATEVKELVRGPQVGENSPLASKKVVLKKLKGVPLRPVDIILRRHLLLVHKYMLALRNSRCVCLHLNEVRIAIAIKLLRFGVIVT
jgi:hypothetical protein